MCFIRVFCKSQGKEFSLFWSKMLIVVFWHLFIPTHQGSTDFWAKVSKSEIFYLFSQRLNGKTFFRLFQAIIWWAEQIVFFSQVWSFDCLIVVFKRLFDERNRSFSFLFSGLIVWLFDCLDLDVWRAKRGRFLFVKDFSPFFPGLFRRFLLMLEEMV